MEAPVSLFSLLENPPEPLVFIQIVDAKGSCPAPIGSKMVYLARGKSLGTIGGGKLEEEAKREAQKVLQEEKPKLLTYDLTPKGLGMWCGGKVTLFYEPHFPPATLWIFGYGHLGKEVADIAQGLPFQVKTVDEEGKKPNHSLTWDTLEPFPPIKERDYVVILLRNPEKELEVLQKLAPHPPRYLGLIGSTTKKKRILSLLEKEGISTKELPLHTPVGLPIGAQTPREIAISILAEIIAHYRKHT